MRGKCAENFIQKIYKKKNTKPYRFRADALVL